MRGIDLADDMVDVIANCYSSTKVEHAVVMFVSVETKQGEMFTKFVSFLSSLSLSLLYYCFCCDFVCEG